MSWPARSMAETLALLTAPGAPFEMVDTEVQGQRLRSYVRIPENLRRVFDDGRRFADRTYLAFEGERLSFDAHWRAATAFGRVLIDRFGIQKGDRVAIAMRNYPEWSICAWGAIAAGAVAVPLNAWESSGSLATLLVDCGAKVAVFDEERLERVLGTGPYEATLVVTRADASDGVIALGDLIGLPGDYATLPDLPIPAPDIAADDPATIFYTSGTTGRPKAAAATHRNILTNYINTGFRAARAAVRRGDPVPAGPSTSERRLLMPMPLFHVTGFHSNLVPAMVNGSTIFLMYKWNVDKALALIENERINALNLVPTLALQLCDRLASTTCDTSSVDLVGYGGSAAPVELAKMVRKAIPTAYPAQGYGATETSSLVAANSHEDMMTRPDSVGTAVPNCDIRIVDEADHDAPLGEPGELWVRGANVVSGYWNQPDASDANFADGWYLTGDIASIDEEGFITILDRVKDMLIRGGENIYCVEIEDCICAHPDVIEAAVYGIPDPVLGEVVGATVHLRDGAHTEYRELAEFVGQRLVAHKVPVAIDIRSQPLPRNAASKVLKNEIRSDALKRLQTG